MLRKLDRLTLCISKSVLSRVTTADKISIVDCTFVRSTAAARVLDAPLVPPIIVSPLENVPEGIVIAKVVLEGLLVTLAVAALVPPVRVSPTEKLVEEPTVIVKVPPG